MTTGGDAAHSVPHLTLLQLTWRFFRFGLLAWGGPVAQIAMLRRSLVDEARWMPSERFNRTLAVYQVLPGPEAQELCVHFGMLARGRIGGLLAGLAFLLPGLAIMLVVAWFYVAVGIDSPTFAAAFAGCQAAVVALVVRGVHRIGSRALRGPWLAAIAACALASTAAGAHFAVPLVIGGLTSVLVERRRVPWAAASLAILVVVTAGLALAPRGGTEEATAEGEPVAAASMPTPVDLLATGLKAGTLTFGGAYTAIPFVQGDAVRDGRWMTNQQFLDGLALSGTIPAPLIIFGTFVGFLGGGLPGALAVTLGIFLPAFAMTLAGHSYLERAVRNERLHAALDGVTAGVIGLVSFTALQLAAAALTDVSAWAIFAAAATVLYAWASGAAVPVVMLAAGVCGILVGGG